MKYLNIVTLVFIATTSAASVPNSACDSLEPSLKEACQKGLSSFQGLEDKVTSCASKCTDDKCKEKCITDNLSAVLNIPEIQEKAKCVSDCKEDNGCIAKCTNGLISKEQLNEAEKCGKDCNNDTNCLLKCSANILSDAGAKQSSTGSSKTSGSYINSANSLVLFAAASSFLLA